MTVTVIIAARMFVGALLLGSGAIKLADRAAFASVVYAFRLVPRRTTDFFATLIPALEALIGAFMIVAVAFDVLASSLAISAAILFSVFATAVTINLLRGNSNISCGCFGQSDSQTLTWGLVVRNLIFCSASLVAARPVSPAGIPVAFSPGDRIGAALLGLGLLLAWMTLHGIRTLWRESAKLQNDIGGHS